MSINPEWLDEVLELRRFCVAHELDGYEQLYTIPTCDLTHKYNGIGPECFCAYLRAKIGKLNPILKPAALIHDVDWDENNGSKEWYHGSNSRFLNNARLCAKLKYGWYNPLRYFVSYKAKLFFNAVETHFGWYAYQKASKK
ncbi:MAG: hypothetical protein WCS73_12180 [Lentisphaeria bacterium]